MSSLKTIISMHRVNISIILFLIMFMAIHYIKPGLIYDANGRFRDFGVGYRNKTVIPIWLVTIILSILSYLSVVYYLAHF